MSNKNILGISVIKLTALCIILFFNRYSSPAYCQVSDQIKSTFKNDEFRHELESIDQVSIDKERIIQDLIKELPRVADNLKKEFQAEAESFFTKKTGYADGFSEEWVRGLYKKFFENLQNDKAFEKKLNLEISTAAESFLRKKIYEFRKEIQDRLNQSFSNYNAFLIEEMNKELKSSFLDVTVDKSDSVMKNLSSELSLVNFRTTFFLPAITMGLKALSSSALKSVIARIFGKAIARSVAIPGEWLGPLGWIVEGGVVAVGAAWDALSIKDKTIRTLTVASTNTFIEGVEKNLRNPRAELIENLANIFTRNAAYLQKEIKNRIQSKWSGRLIHSKSPDWQPFSQAFPASDQFKMLDTVVAVFGHECGHLDFKVKYAYSNALPLETAKGYLQKFGHDFPELIYGFDADMKKILAGFKEEKRLVDMILREKTSQDRSKVIRDALEFLDAFPQPKTELVKLFLFLKERKIELAYTDLTVPRADFLGKNLDSLGKLYDSEPEIVKSFFDKLGQTKDEQLKKMVSNTSFEFGEVLILVNTIGLEKTMEVLNSSDSGKFFRNYGFENGGKMVAIWGLGIIKAYSMPDCDQNRSVEIWKKLPPDNVSKELEYTAIWVIRNTSWNSDEVTIPLLNQLKAPPGFYFLAWPIIGTSFAELVKITNSSNVSAVAILFVLFFLLMILYKMFRMFRANNDPEPSIKGSVIETSSVIIEEGKPRLQTNAVGQISEKTDNQKSEEATSDFVDTEDEKLKITAQEQIKLPHDTKKNGGNE
jgi:hypothetical protein